MERSYFEVNWEVEEVVFVLMIFIYLLQKHLLSVLVRNIPYHDCGSCVS